MSVNIQAKHKRARDNRAYVRELLAERQPGLAAVLRAVERQLDVPRPDDFFGVPGGAIFGKCAVGEPPAGSTGLNLSLPLRAIGKVQ